MLSFYLSGRYEALPIYGKCLHSMRFGGEFMSASQNRKSANAVGPSYKIAIAIAHCRSVLNSVLHQHMSLTGARPIACSRARPERRISQSILLRRISKSCQRTPSASPVPNAFAQASLIANPTAAERDKSSNNSMLACSVLENTSSSHALPNLSTERRIGLTLQRSTPSPYSKPDLPQRSDGDSQRSEGNQPENCRDASSF